MSHGPGQDNLTMRGYCISNEAEKLKLFVARREGLYRYITNTRTVVTLLILLRLDPNAPNDEPKKLASGEFIYGIDYDYDDKKIFWTDRLAHAAFSADVDEQGDIENIKKLSLKSLIYPRAVAVDWITNTLYIIESGTLA